MDTSIGDLALKILEGDIQDIRKGKKARPNTNSVTQVTPEPQGLDISNTRISNSFMDKILTESFGLKVKPVITTPAIVKVPPLNVPEQSNNNLQEAIQKLDDTIGYLVALKGTLNEMTTAGMMGVNFAGPQKDSKDDDEDECEKPKSKAKAKGKLKLKFKKK